MELLCEKIELLNQIDREWVQTVKENWENEEPAENKELLNVFTDFFTEAREAYKQNEASVVEIFEAYFSHSADWLLEEIRKSLQVFYLLSVFRMIDNRNNEMGKKIINYCFDNVILRFDPQFAGIYEEFGYEAIQDFVDTARCMDSLVEYYVVRHWTKDAIVRDLRRETGLEERTCVYISWKIEKNYYMLQMNAMMDMLQE